MLTKIETFCQSHNRHLANLIFMLCSFTHDNYHTINMHVDKSDQYKYYLNFLCKYIYLSLFCIKLIIYILKNLTCWMEPYLSSMFVSKTVIHKIKLHFILRFKFFYLIKENYILG